MRVVMFIVGIAMCSMVAAEEEKMALCKEVSGLAETVMDRRQSGIPMVSMMEVVKGSDVFEAMVIDAYEQPAFQMSENQESAVAQFRDRWYLMCVKEAK